MAKENYFICPSCGSDNVIRSENQDGKLECLSCEDTWIPVYAGYVRRKSKAAKKLERENTVHRFDLLKQNIEKAKLVDNAKQKHLLILDIDREFSVLCEKKYEAYSRLGTFEEDYENEYYFNYLNNRLNKMIKDIDRILFYFDN